MQYNSVDDMKKFLLIAGENYYPEAGTGDWIAAFETEEDTKAEVAIIQPEDVTTGIYNYNFDRFLIRGCKYDWYKIVNLEEWTKDNI